MGPPSECPVCQEADQCSRGALEKMYGLNVAKFSNTACDWPGGPEKCPVCSTCTSSHEPVLKKPVGYHKAPIKKGTLGFISKIQEEVDELQDASSQGAKLMILQELSDVYGAMEAYLRNKFPGFTMEDIKKMSDITKRAFESGERT